MKNDLATSIIAAVIGTVTAYFLCNFLIPPIGNVEFKVLDPTNDTTYSLTEPNAEVFNYRSVNPTVEVYVGQCENGDCNSNIVDNSNESNTEEEKNENENVENPTEENEAVNETEDEGENTDGTTD